MPDRFPPINPRFPHMLHGGDYNPEQWAATPEVWDDDIRLMKLAHWNSVSIGIFSWVSLEPEEGRFEFGWLDKIFDNMSQAGVGVVLATPSGARPAWMAQKYPEVLRVDGERKRQLWGGRHNHCMTSPVYREKCRIINTKLAERYGHHASTYLWHISNEYSGECHCDLCQEAFRGWLKKRYDNSLDKLNHAWWTAFWSHTYTDWGQVESPSPIGENGTHGHTLDWRRFSSDQIIDFMIEEGRPLRKVTPKLPQTTNMMGGFHGIDYYKMAEHLDLISWDSYPSWKETNDDWREAVTVSFVHNQRRAMLSKPWLLMESSPSTQNWHKVNKLKRPGVQLAEGLQAVANGSDGVMYFQWRKARGASEKFHGAVADHHGGEKTRAFGDIARNGEVLGMLDDVVGMTHRAEAAVIYDYQNHWVLNDIQGQRNGDREYAKTCVEHYRPFFHNGVSADIIGADSDFSRYKLLVAPMLYSIRPGVAERIEKFVEAGGTFVATYYSGMANESDLLFQTGYPGPLRKLLGIWVEETDALYDDERVPVMAASGNRAGLSGAYEARHLCDLVHAEGAQVLATYGAEFYACRPAATMNQFGAGRAYYVASRNDERFNDDLFSHLIDMLNLKRALGVRLPDGVLADVRTDGNKDVTFVISFRRDEVTIPLGERRYRDRLTGREVSGRIVLAGHGSMVLDRL